MVKFDLNKCVGCGECVRDCVANVIYLAEGKARLRDEGCIECKHCYAVCPTEAVITDGVTGAEGEQVSLTEFDGERLLQAMKSRRSIRRYKDIPVEKEKLQMLLEAGRYCPTASNAQGLHFTVLGSKQAELEKICVGMFRRGKNLAAPFYPAVTHMEIDDSFFFKGAPLVIVVSAKGGGLNRGNANLASSYMELLAGSLGLGVLYSGFFVVCTKLSGKVRKLLALPRGYKPVTCMVMGYPDVKYHRIPPRNTLEFKEL